MKLVVTQTSNNFTQSQQNIGFFPKHSEVESSILVSFIKFFVNEFEKQLQAIILWDNLCNI